MSLSQRTYERAKRLTSKIYVVSEAGHIHHVKDQLPDLSKESFIVEPARRGTSNCILAALAQISKDHGDDEPIVFLSADHYIRDIRGFEHSFKVAAKASLKYERIVLVGVEPDYPATGLGYIQKGDVLDEQTFTFDVHSFKEKPDHDTARSYLHSGQYLWNCGYFVGSVDTFKHAMEQYAPDLLKDYQRLLEATPETYEQTYLDLKNISIDYALIEKVKDLVVVPASFDWMDLGSFGDFHKAVGADEKGNHTAGNVEIEDVRNSFIQNQEEKPVAVIGLDNVVVINTPNGILVARKDLSQKVGEVSKRLNA